MANSVLVFIVSEILLMGFKEVNFTDKRVNQVKGDPTISTTNIQRFNDHYGCSPDVVAALWEDLQ